jgi:hypothetical protein
MSQQGQQVAQRPPQHQNRQPGVESEMEPAPSFQRPEYRGAEAGGQGGPDYGRRQRIGGSVAVFFSKRKAEAAVVDYQ